ncbi:hypothetical protein U9M48_010157 [Paspalum notatum var. saurae]|uniref:Uncharacterized protein n=1 Tax=Paspalum notatum var. saurae TaxID=547442 RepID=A0AAQ3STH5_PASNO
MLCNCQRDGNDRIIASVSHRFVGPACQSNCIFFWRVLAAPSQAEPPLPAAPPSPLRPGSPAAPLLPAALSPPRRG